MKLWLFGCSAKKDIFITIRNGKKKKKIILSVSKYEKLYFEQLSKYLYHILNEDYISV